MTEADNNTTGLAGEAEIVRLAHAVVETEAAYAASFEPPATTIAEEEAREPMQERLSAARNVHLNRLTALPAVTLAGIIAKARAAYAMAIKDPHEGEIIVHGVSDVLAFCVVEDLLAYSSTMAAGEVAA